MDALLITEQALALLRCSSFSLEEEAKLKDLLSQQLRELGEALDATDDYQARKAAKALSDSDNGECADDVPGVGCVPIAGKFIANS